jgi:hypothetical protein
VQARAAAEVLAEELDKWTPIVLAKGLKRRLAMNIEYPRREGLRPP